MSTSTPIIFKGGGDKSILHELFVCRVFFGIPSDLRERDYVEWLTLHFQAFIRSLSDDRGNHNEAERFYFSPHGQQGGIGMLNIGETYFYGCKVYVFDGRTVPYTERKQGILMRDHEDMRSQVKPIYEFAERFEKFLSLRGIPYTRFGRKVGHCEDLQQVTQFS